MSRIAIATVYHAIPELKAINKPNLDAYAARHDYERIVENYTLDSSRPPSWSKIKSLLHHLPDYDYILWMDADTLITNFEVEVDELMSPPDDGYTLVDFWLSDLLASYDPVSAINLGVFLARNTPATLALLETIWNQTDLINHPWWEQAALARLIRERHPAAGGVSIAAPRLLQSWPHTPDHRREMWWELGDFCIHFPGMKPDARLAAMQSCLSEHP